MIAHMHVVIFEGIHWRTFAPLSLSRPVFMLGTGMTTLLEKQIRHTGPRRLTLWVRPEMVEFTRRRIVPKLSLPAAVNEPLNDEPALLVSGRTLHFRKYDTPDAEAVVLDEGEVVRSAYVRRPGLRPEDAMARNEKWMSVVRLPQMEPRTRLVERLWDLIKWNEESLVEDFLQMQRQSAPRPAGAYHIINDEQVWIGEGAVIEPGAVLDGSNGPVVIDQNAQIGANAVIQGPCYIGKYTQVMPLGMIRGGSSIGMMCKVGGDIYNSIIFGYSNKVHEGFLGDSYVGKWVNLGAGTTTSNLKNTYGEISVTTPKGEMKTGRRFLGSLIGDHVKTAIGTRLMAGSYVGFSSMLACSAIAPKFVPSFSFLTDGGRQRYDLDKAMEVIRTVFSRRERQVDELDEQIVKYAAGVAPEIEGMRP